MLLQFIDEVLERYVYIWYRLVGYYHVYIICLYNYSEYICVCNTFTPQRYFGYTHIRQIPYAHVTTITCKCICMLHVGDFLAIRYTYMH